MNGIGLLDAAPAAVMRPKVRNGMHILVLTKLDDGQVARLKEVVEAHPKVTLTMGQAAMRETGIPVTAVLGAPPPELIGHMHRLEWVQLRTDDLDAWVKCLEAFDERGITVTRTRGSYSDTVPDHALMLVLALARDLPRLLSQRRSHAWKLDDLQPVVLSRATLLVVGFGHIGTRIAARALAFGMRVTAVDPAPGEVPVGVETVVPPERLDEVLPEADFVVLTVPANSQTAGWFNAERLGRMKSTAVLINVGRGLVVNTDDLLAALKAGVVAGAGLDVVDPSPLPADHPLWEHPRVLLTCHTAQKGSHFAEAQFDTILENVRRYLAGEELLHVVLPEHWR